MKPQVRKLSRISQGDIYKDIEYIEYAVEKSGDIEISKISFPYVVVLTQDCDLKRDFKFRYGRPRPNNQDKFLLSVLVAPLYNIEHFFLGEQLSTLGINMQKIKRNKSPASRIKSNRDVRYHYLEFPQDIPIVSSVIDFKHYFSVNIEYLKKQNKNNFVCRIPPMHREKLSQRYANFLARIGLPERNNS
jgi:hypothetical protein